MVCLCRALFFTVILIRFLFISSVTLAGGLLTICAILLGILYSLWVVLFVRRPPTGEWPLLVSVAIDSVALFGSLLPNALWPTQEYVGVLYVPDTMAILVATMGAGLRLSPVAALAGGLLNSVSLLVLVSVDRAILGASFYSGYFSASLYLLWIGGSTLVAMVLAWSSRRLAYRSATAAAQAERAEQGLWSILGDHHDLRSMITSASIDAEVVVGELEERAPIDPRALRSAQSLSHTLGTIRNIVTEIKDRALVEVDGERQLEAVEVAPVVEALVHQARVRNEDLEIEWSPPAAPVVALVAGGEAAFHRVVLNLLTNACEGDGLRRPAVVTVKVEADRGARSVRVTIDDDGPGLSERGTDEGGPAASTKPAGTGVGLPVVRGLVEASGGSLQLSPRSPGTRVTVTLGAE